MTLAVLLKVFQRLGHLPRLQDVPFAIVSHVRSSREDLAQLSPYQTRRLKRFGDYTLSLGAPDPFETDLVVPFPIEETAQTAATA